MDIAVERQGNIAVAILPAVEKIAPVAADEQMRSALENIITEGGIKGLIVDLSAVEYCGTRMLSVVVTLHIKAKRLAKQVRFCGASEFVSDGLAKTNLDKILQIYETREQAMFNFAH